MLKEGQLYPGDPTLTRAIFSLNPKDRRVFSINGHNITVGLPDLKTVKGRIVINIPNSPYIFHTRIITFFTEKGHYRSSFTLFNQVVILGHGNIERRDPLGWEFADGQDPLKITADFNASNIGLPRIDTIICCREVIPTLRVGALVEKAGQVYQRDTIIPNTQFPHGWPYIPNVIIQKCGIVDFAGEVDGLGIESFVKSKESDFYRISKKGKPINLRKHLNNQH